MPLVTRRTTSERSRPASREDDDQDEDDRPRKPRNAEERIARKRERDAREPRFQEPEGSDDGDEDDRPRSRRSRDEDDEPRGRRDNGRRNRDEDDESDDDRAARSAAVQSGWGAANKLKKEGGNFANELSITKDAQLVKFLGDSPYAVYKQHWIDGGLRSTKKKSFICMGKGCPLCTIGEGAAKKWAFNVALFEKDDWVVYSLIAGSRLFDNIADEHEGSDGPLDEGFWTISKSGTKQSTTYKLKKIEGRKLEEFLDSERSDIRDEDELLESLEDAVLEPYTAAQHQPPSRSYLQEIADELIGDDD